MIRNFIIFFILVLSANAALALNQSRPAIVDTRPVVTATYADYKENKGEMKPLPQELLKKPIRLSGVCSKVQIIEWRGSKISKESTKSIDKTCNIAVKGFKPFIKEQRGYQIHGEVSKFDTNLCLLPLNSDPRNMNDIDYRFYYRSLKIDLWGYFQRAADNIYIRSDILTEGQDNGNFDMTLAHELFHAMSYQYNIFHQHDGDKDAIEEDMADQFTEYLGLGS
jgi:hypothetical protein